MKAYIQQPVQQHRKTKQHAKAQTKAHTEQPAPPITAGERVLVGIGTILGVLLVPCIVVAFVVYKWRVAKARMGYRTVTHDLTPAQRELLADAEAERQSRWR